MGEKLVVGPINKGQVTNRTAFVIDNDAFPTITNAYQWRGRVKRKRGTWTVGRLQRFLGTTDGSGNLSVTIVPSPLTAGLSNFTVGSTTYSDPGGTGTVNLLVNGTGTATLTYSTAALVITGGPASTSVYYYPGLPVMGLEEYIAGYGMYPGTVGFDTTYAYNISSTFPYPITDISFYKNPASGTYPSYVAKSSLTPLHWNGANYQQFWTTNYQNAMWETNGIAVPFSTENIGMQFKKMASIAYASATTVTITITEAAASLIIGDFVFINEVKGTDNGSVNLQTGYVTASSNNGTTTTLTVKLPYATVANETYSGGILQYLTNTAVPTEDCLRWYDGNPSDASGLGWVNFAPPLSQDVYIIADNPELQYYLVGARLIWPFKDRLLFFGAIIQASTGNPIYCQDTIIYSQNGTPYYTASFTGDPTFATTAFNPILVPANQSATASSWFEDVTGFGGFFTAGLDQPIISVAPNEDVLLLGFSSFQTRLVYTGNDLVPFNLFIVNSEFGSNSTFSSITLDKGVLTRGNRGFVITSQTGSERFDLQIPDQAFEISIESNGSERICAIRNFEEEWAYFTYRDNNSPVANYIYPTQSLLYNYRDESFGIINECYTTYGAFRRATGQTWATLPTTLKWSSWTDPWNSGTTTLLQPEVIGGNQQGFVLVKDTDTSEGTSLFIQNISGSTITSPSHQLNNDDFVLITGCTGGVSSTINGNIYRVATSSLNTFTALNDDFPISGTYTGNGVIQRVYVPQVMTKQFPIAWDMMRKTRIGMQQYLFTNTNVAYSQIALLIFLSQNSESAYNYGNIVPADNSVNNSLIYSTILYTCPESENIGLTPANVNLNLVTADAQQQIWHRMNTSLIGDTVQIGFTISIPQMYLLDPNGNPINAFCEFELHGFVLDVQPSQLLC